MKSYSIKDVKRSCSTCNINKPLSEYGKSKRATVFGYKRRCLECEDKLTKKEN